MVQRLVFYINIIRTKILLRRWKKMSDKSKINGVCLVFHHITDQPDNSGDCCKCDVPSFIGIVEGLQESGYSIISLDDYQSFIVQHPCKKFAIITFDDVPEDMFIYGYPYLKHKQIPFTVFITTSFIDKPGYLSSEQIMVLNSDPLCTIGAHTITHPLLRFNNNKELEINESGNILEQLIGKKVCYFAYPFGSLYSTDKQSIKIAKKRYVFAFSTINTGLNDFTIQKKWFLPRKAINSIQQL